MDGVRISRDQMLMEMAEVIAKRGTCSRLQVGVVVSRRGRIIATGYNGAPAGLPHCDHSRDKLIGFEVNDAAEIADPNSKVWQVNPGNIAITPPTMEVGCTVAVHAEQNAISFAARHGLALEGGEMHVTHAPCAACARSIINAGIVKVYFLHPYRLTEGVELLQQAGIGTFDMSPWVG